MNEKVGNHKREIKSTYLKSEKFKTLKYNI